MSGTLHESVEKFLGGFTWLLLDAFLLVLMLGGFVAYSDFDSPMQKLIRGFVVMGLFVFWISSFHLLVYLRNEKDMPGCVSYSFMGFKFVALAAFAWWLWHNNII